MLPTNDAHTQAHAAKITECHASKQLVGLSFIHSLIWRQLRLYMLTQKARHEPKIVQEYIFKKQSPRHKIPRPRNKRLAELVMMTVCLRVKPAGWKSHCIPNTERAVWADLLQLCCLFDRGLLILLIWSATYQQRNRFIACQICIELRNMQDKPPSVAPWLKDFLGPGLSVLLT